MNVRASGAPSPPLSIADALRSRGRCAPRTTYRMGEQNALERPPARSASSADPAYIARGGARADEDRLRSESGRAVVDPAPPGGHAAAWRSATGHRHRLPTSPPVSALAISSGMVTSRLPIATSSNRPASCSSSCAPRPAACAWNCRPAMPSMPNPTRTARRADSRRLRAGSSSFRKSSSFASRRPISC